MSKQNQAHRGNRQHAYEGGMYEQLGKQLGRSLPPKPVVAQLPVSASRWKKDGEDHINIDPNALTELGQLLDFGARSHFKHSIFRGFATVRGFWYYIRSNETPEKARHLAGPPLVALGLRLTNNKHVKHLKAMVLDAAYQRIKQAPELYKAFYANTLPFDTYSVVRQTGLRMRNQNYEWIIPGYMEIQRAIHQGIEPDFTPWCDGYTDDIYESVRPTPIPENVKVRPLSATINQDDSEQPATAPKPKHEQRQQKPKEANKPKEKKEPPQKKQKPSKPKFLVRVRREQRKHTAEDGCCTLFPVVSEMTEDLILKEFRAPSTINGIEIPTGFLCTNQEIPLLGVSLHPKLAELGLIRDDDVIRSTADGADGFKAGFQTLDLMKLHAIAYRNGDEVVYVPMAQRILAATIPGRFEQQTHSVREDDGMITVERRCTIARGFNSLFDQNGGKPKVVVNIEANLAKLREDNPDLPNYTQLLMEVGLTIQMRRELSPVINIGGWVRIYGVSTGQPEDPKAVTELFEETATTHDVDGYMVGLMRGQVKLVDVTAEIAEAYANLDAAAAVPVVNELHDSGEEREQLDVSVEVTNHPDIIAIDSTDVADDSSASEQLTETTAE